MDRDALYLEGFDTYKRLDGLRLYYKTIGLFTGLFLFGLNETH